MDGSEAMGQELSLRTLRDKECENFHMSEAMHGKVINLMVELTGDMGYAPKPGDINDKGAISKEPPLMETINGFQHLTNVKLSMLDEALNKLHTVLFGQQEKKRMG